MSQRFETPTQRRKRRERNVRRTSPVLPAVVSKRAQRLFNHTTKRADTEFRILAEELLDEEE